MKIRKYIYLFLIIAVLFLTSSCISFKKYEVKIYDGNGNIIENLSVNKGYYVNLNNYDVPQKNSDEKYDYYFSGWDHEETFEVTSSVEIHPNFEKYPAGLSFYTSYKIGFEYEENTKDKYKFYTVTSYEGNATSVEIPEKVGFPLDKKKKISSYLPVQVIGEKAFYNNETIEEVIIPNGILSINKQAFWKCTALKNVNIPSTVTTINEQAFRNCESITKITIPSTIKNVKEAAFYGCTELKEVIFEQNDSINLYNEIFSQCEKLEIVTLPNSITNIPDSMFSSCENLTKINFDGEIKNVYSDAFNECKNLDLSFIDFSKLEYIGEYAFYKCTTLPKKLDLTKVRFESNSFDGCTSIEEVIFNQDTTEIDGFYGCTNLSKINFSELTNLKIIGGLGNTNITKIDLSNNEKITKVKISNTVLEELILHHDVKDKSSAKKLVILNGELVDKISKDCEEIVLPNDIKAILTNSFSNCDSLVSVTIPSSVEIIEENAFANCFNLEQIIFESNSLLKTISKNAFTGCDKLYDINISNCKKLTTIEDGAFSNCVSLTNFEFESLDSLTTIGDSAFQSTNIRVMKLPAKTTDLGSNLPKLLSFIYIPRNCGFNASAFTGLKIIIAYESGTVTSNTHNYIGIKASEIYYDDEGFVYLLGSDLNATIVRYCGLKRDVVTPDSVNVNNIEYTVDEIGKYAFGGDFVTSLKVSDSIKSAYSYFFDGLTYSYLRNPYINLRILSVGANFKHNLITKYETHTGINVIEGYSEYEYSQFNILNSYLDEYINFDDERYQINNLISAEGLNPNSSVLIGTKTHVYSKTYETYPSYKEKTTEYTNNYLSSLNEGKYDIVYHVIDGFIFNNQKTVCLGYLGEYKTHLVLPTLEEGYECSFIINEYHCNTYDVPENVTLKYK